MVASAWRAIRAVWKEAYTDYALRIYERRNLAHYAPNGRGYVNVQDLSRQACVDAFSDLESRLELFVDAFPLIIGYRDGESFLDAGCGKGQNLKFIARRYANSSYTGFDVDERCLQVAGEGEGEGANRCLVQGSILDSDFLSSFPDKSVDHICMSYVFSTLLEPTISEVQRTHQRVVDEFTRIARRTVIILDSLSLGDTIEVEIEQRTRATIRENIAAYFEKHRSSGEACILARGALYAVLFKVRDA